MFSVLRLSQVKCQFTCQQNKPSSPSLKPFLALYRSQKLKLSIKQQFSFIKWFQGVVSVLRLPQIKSQNPCQQTKPSSPSLKPFLAVYGSQKLKLIIKKQFSFIKCFQGVFSVLRLSQVKCQFTCQQNKPSSPSLKPFLALYGSQKLKLSIKQQFSFIKWFQGVVSVLRLPQIKSQNPCQQLNHLALPWNHF